MNWTKLAFSMMWLMEILKIYQDEKFLRNYYVIKHLILLKVQNMKDVKLDLLLWFIFFFDENSSCAVTCTNTYAIKSKIMSNQQLAEELHKAIIRKFEK